MRAESLVSEKSGPLTPFIPVAIPLYPVHDDDQSVLRLHDVKANSDVGESGFQTSTSQSYYHQQPRAHTTL